MVREALLVSPQRTSVMIQIAQRKAKYPNFRRTSGIDIDKGKHLVSCDPSPVLC